MSSQTDRPSVGDTFESRGIKRKRPQQESCQCVDQITPTVKRNLELPENILMHEALAILIGLRYSGIEVCNYHIPFLAKKLQLREVSLSETKLRINVVPKNDELITFLEWYKKHREWFIQPVQWWKNKTVAENHMQKIGEAVIVIDD